MAPLEPSTQIEVSVVVVSWNVRDMLRDCVASVLDETRAPLEVIVVDNASGDGSVEMLAHEFPDVRVVANHDNRGFAAANNQGLGLARGDNVLLLNPDTIILDGAVDTMLEWLARHPDVGCVGCQVLETATDVQATCFRDPTPLNLLLVETGLHRVLPGAWADPGYEGWDRDDERDVDVVSGMFMLVPRPVLDVVGGLDDSFFVYSEEADWCRRIRDAGYRCVFSPAARILHREGGGKSTDQIRPRMYVQLQKSKMIYLAKHHGRSGWLAGKAVFLTTMGARAAVFGALWLATRRPRFRARAALARASVWFHLTGRSPR